MLFRKLHHIDVLGAAARLNEVVARVNSLYLLQDARHLARLLRVLLLKIARQCTLLLLPYSRVIRHKKVRRPSLPTGDLLLADPSVGSFEYWWHGQRALILPAGRNHIRNLSQLRLVATPLLAIHVVYSFVHE